MNNFVSCLLLFFFISGSFATAFNLVSASVFVEDSWNAKTPMSEPRGGLGLAVVDGKIYAIGGYRGYGDFLDVNECYDPKTNTWTTLASMPTARRSFGIVEHEGKIYCIGGIIHDDGQWFTCRANEVYDIATDSWSTQASIPFEGFIGRNTIGVQQAHVVNGKIFVINSGVVYLYNPVADFWTKKSSAPYTGYDASAVVGNKIIVYVSNMFSYMTFEAKAMMYDTETDKWSEIEPQPFLAKFSGDASAGATTGRYAPQKVYVFIGRNTWVHDLVSDTWFSGKNMPAGDGDVTCNVVVVDDLLYVIGSSVHEQYVPLGYGSVNVPPSTSDSLVSAEPYFNYVFVLILAVGIAMTAVIVVAYFFVSKSRRFEGRYQMG